MLSYKITSSYSLFSDSITGNNIIELTVSDSLDLSGANKPLLSESMIPVYYDETCDRNQGCWRKADKENKNDLYKWYDYDEKMWANSVTVSSTNRSTYLEATEGTKIPMEDILTMQVWVPRYKYKIFNYNEDGTKYTSPQVIDITFEKGIQKTGTVNCTDDLNNIYGTSEYCFDNTLEGVKDNISTYTHPAFTFGDKELTGIWVGKFEIGNNIDSIEIKPNITSIRNNNVSTFANNIMKMNDNENIYGFNEEDDIHMMKNIEWGAVAYLSHSKYGICEGNKCEKIGKNNNSDFITGCGNKADSNSSTTCNKYETETGQKASTTGNIYGIYDMNGGSYEYVMGNTIYTDDEQMISGYSTKNSGYNSIVYNEQTKIFETFESENKYPESKYYDKYSFDKESNSFKRGKLGDATKEVKKTSGEYGGWYNENSYMINHGASWFLRGYSHTSLNGGIFSHTYHYGNEGESYSTRAVISNTDSINEIKQLCEIEGPYIDQNLTSKTNYAYNDEEIYYSLTCSSKSGINKTEVVSDKIKSSNEKIINNINIISTSNYTNQNGDTGYKYIIRAKVNDYNDENHNVYLYLEPYDIADKENKYDMGTKSNVVNTGLLSKNKRNNSKDILTCNVINNEKELKMESILSNRINKVGVGTRQAVVEAARFLSIDFPYIIPYYWADGLKKYPTAGVYINTGLYITPDNSDDKEDIPWGCNRIKKSAYGFFEIGQEYPNGLDCAGYINWVLTNGGLKESGVWSTEIFNDCSSGCDLFYQATYNPETHQYGYSNFFEYYMSKEESTKTYNFWSILNPESKKCINSECGLTEYSQIDSYDIKAGDLIWKKGHIGIIIGITIENNKQVYVVSESTYYRNSDGTFSTRGIRTVSYYTEQLYKSGVGWTHIIKMDDIYGEGNLTNYNPFWVFK